MGNDCFTTRPNQVYKKYLSQANIGELKSQWKTLELYKINQIFQSHAQKDVHTNVPVIKAEQIRQVFSEFHRYEQKQISRICEIFDFQNSGCIDWANFYMAITFCSKAPVQMISLLMFMIFDQSLARELNPDQLNLLVDFNSNYVRQSSVDHQAYIYDPDGIGEVLLSSTQESLSIEKWQRQSVKIFDFQKYRKFFNIFIEVKLEKQLIQNFQSWNEIYNQKENKYISYVLDFKWFQLWKSYVFTEYGVKINSGTKNPNTIKTLKSLKTNRTLKTINSIKTQRKIFTKSIIKNSSEQETLQSKGGQNRIKNYNLINSKIGSKPLKMFNQQLQGQFLQVLAPQLVQNIDYTLVSQKVWNRLKFIYQGYPEFRRTGPNSIQLYPKRVKIYSSLFQAKLDYSSEIIREVPCCTKVEDLLKQSLEIQNLSQKSIFFKTIGMNKWEELTDLSYMFTQLTAEIIIFLSYFDAGQAQIFRKSHCKIAQHISEVNLGDEIRYDLQQQSDLKKMIFMGETQNGKQIIHFKGSSYIYDQFIDKETFYQKATLVHRYTLPVEETKISPLEAPIIPIVKSFGFINSLIIMLLSNPQIKNILSQYPSSENKQILDFLAHLFKQSKKKTRVDSNIVADLVQQNLPEYLNFQFGMIDNCYRAFMQKVEKGLRKLQFPNVIREQYYFCLVKKVKCLHCRDLNTYSQKTCSLSIDLPDTLQKYFQFTFVPFSSTLKSLDIKKYGLKMKATATYKSYKSEISKLIECENQHFVICQVYRNDIIRNFTHVKEDTTLEQMNLKETDNIFVYELFTSLSRFVIDHYTQVKDITHKKFKKNQFIDCKIDDNKWMAAKIIEIQFMPYTQKTLIKVIHKDDVCANPKTSYELTPETTAIFPTKSYLYGEQYHLKMLQRHYNEALNEMHPSNIPLAVVLTDWMRFKQFELIVYQQIKIFIAQNYRFKDMQSFQEDQHASRTNFLSYKQSKTDKIKKFTQYMYSQNFPYKISILDLNGRCMICFKIHKSCILKGESDYYCSGCKLNNDSPISWQIKLHNCMVCIDWQGLNRFKKNIIKDHKSFTDMIMNKKNDIQRLQKLIQEKLSRKIDVIQQDCCNYPYKTLYVEELKSYPEILVIQIQRLSDNGNNTSIIRKHINFPFTDLKVETKTYFLTGLISIEGNSNLIYKNYVSNQNQEWFQIHGQTIKKVKKNLVQKACAILLVYKLTPNQQVIEGKLSDCRQSEEFINSQLDSDFQVSPRIFRKELTINQRLQNVDSDQSNSCQLDTESQDKIKLQNEDQQDQNDSEVPPERSNSKRSAKYVKDSKQLIKSVSECGKSSHSSKQNLMLIRLDNFKESKNNNISNSVNKFNDVQRNKKSIKLQFNTPVRTLCYEQEIEQDKSRADTIHQERNAKRRQSSLKQQQKKQDENFALMQNWIQQAVTNNGSLQRAKQHDKKIFQGQWGGQNQQAKADVQEQGSYNSIDIQSERQSDSSIQLCIQNIE